MAKKQQAEKSKARDAGVYINVDGRDVLFDTDVNARMAYADFYTAVKEDPLFKVDYWKASTGEWICMDAAMYQKVRAAGTAHIMAIHNWQSKKDAELDAIKLEDYTNINGAVQAVQAINAVYG